ncbi:DUF3016 domain-containing protein [Pseudoduganella plicata]|uniref:DUF3016 domain-containing protein n=1 Tax=Pseudoduganella plicata TaxID=321984 RepID=A0A4P7BEU4_9BURK|nr:DUF3016 domain-containing protein [Pseudoduganella plicata]QBQ36703.1 DUF3016 domain-containing protein [Pseudoduganella plicata]GGY73387.1 hypothetical protein GCM10007388_01860 [Pseudoduganella plicata]
MKPRIRRAALAAALLLPAIGAFAGAKVTYVQPEKMTDVPRFPSDRESMEITFREHLEKLSERLPAGQQLVVEFLDIDLAGDVFPRVPVQDIRVLKGRADWPRMHLRYRIEQDGAVLRSGERELADPNYLMHSSRHNGELYQHEKIMLDDWFRKEVLAERR